MHPPLTSLPSPQRRRKSVEANGDCREPETRFRATWRSGRIFLRASNGCYLGTLPVGLVVARALRPGERGRRERGALSGGGGSVEALLGEERAREWGQPSLPACTRHLGSFRAPRWAAAPRPEKKPGSVCQPPLPRPNVGLRERPAQPPPSPGSVAGGSPARKLKRKALVASPGRW